MNQGPVSCLPMNSKMSKVKKALDEARETQNRELDLVDKNVFSFDEMPGLRKYPINTVKIKLVSPMNSLFGNKKKVMNVLNGVIV